MHRWRVVRTQLLDSVPSLRNQNTSSAKDSWNADQDDWGQGQDDWGQNKDDWGQGQDDWGQGQDDWGQSQSSCDCSQAQSSEGNFMCITPNIPPWPWPPWYTLFLFTVFRMMSATDILSLLDLFYSSMCSSVFAVETLTMISRFVSVHHFSGY